MVSTKDLCFFILLSLLCVVNLDANLLPDTLVRTGSYTFSNVEALEFGDSLLSVNDNYNDNNLQCVLDRARVVQKKLMPSYVNRVTKLELVSSSGRRGYLYIGKKQRFYRWNALAELKPKLLKHVKEKNREFLEILLRVIWVKAKDLKKGDKLLGLNNDVVTVIKVKTIELEESIDSYDLSLTWPHTFFVVDSSGNSLLTHNIIATSTILWTIGICAGVGAIVGIKAVVNHTRGKISAKAILSGAIVGGIIGGGAAAGYIYLRPVVKTVYKKILSRGQMKKGFHVSLNEDNFKSLMEGGIRQVSHLNKVFGDADGLEFNSKIFYEGISNMNKDELKQFIPTVLCTGLDSEKLKWAKDIIKYRLDYLDLEEKFQLILPSFIRCIGEGCAIYKVVIPTTMNIISLSAEKVVEYFELKENEDIDFSGIDVKEEFSAKKSSRKDPVLISDIAIDVLHDKNGNPVRDENGTVVPLFVARYEFQGDF